MSFIYFLSGALASFLFGGAKTIYAILVEGIMGNLHVKVFKIWTIVQEEMLFKEKVNRWMEDRRRPIQYLTLSLWPR